MRTALVAVGLAFAVWSADAHACGCLGTPLDSPDLGLIVVGEVVDVEPYAPQDEWGPRQIYSFEVLVRWKGPSTRIVRVEAGGNTSCDSRFTEGEIYFLTASGAQEPFGTGECHDHGSIEQHTDLILSLGPPEFRSDGFALPSLDTARLRAALADPEKDLATLLELSKTGAGAAPLLPDLLAIAERDTNSLRAASALATASKIAPRDPRFLDTAKAFLAAAPAEQLVAVYVKSVLGPPMRAPIPMDDGRSHRRPLSFDAPEFAVMLPSIEQLLGSKNPSLQFLATQSLGLTKHLASVDPTTGRLLTREQEHEMFLLILRSSDDLVRSRAWLWLALGSPPHLDSSDLGLDDFAARDLWNERCHGFVVMAIASQADSESPRLTAESVFERALALAGPAEILALGDAVDRLREQDRLRLDLLCEWCERARAARGLDARTSVCPWLDERNCPPTSEND